MAKTHRGLVAGVMKMTQDAVIGSLLRFALAKSMDTRALDIAARRAGAHE